ncbi:extracellular solute-binding protein family 1 [Crinalium epipsammum PCC 9333]|uniref:Extracellular solute-binding protein family 1 n=1 Tax=Crinalium epipsammum PCC 9333 TaxID=1173022 RepID=K9W3A8_9CYAN|nr:spermidine/putrescine ABC transporter substrate-binding protein [Crinalium epipsammum]AFZ13920.1 extracellular solute-binding protein family 1 [Crinalium epipsammum PCC 9333]
MPSTVYKKALINSTRRRFIQTSAAALSGLALSSCGWTLAQVRSTPTNAGRGDNKLLYIYTWAGYTDEDLLNRFTQDTGIKVIADVFDSNEAMLAKIQASGGGEYSIIYPSDYMVRQMVELKMLTELDHSRLLGLDQLFPKFQNPTYDPDNRYSVPMTWGTTGLIYNTTKLKNQPQDWNYLWDQQKQLSRKMTLQNDLREVMGATLKMLGYSYNSTDPQQIKQAYEKLAQLKPSIASFTSDAWRSQILTGDLLVAMCVSSDANDLIPEAENLQYVLPRSGSSLWTDTLVIPKTAPNPEAAYAWINYMLQPEVTAAICQRLSFATPNKVAFNLLPPDVRDNPVLFPPESLLAKCEGIAPLPDKVKEIYEAYWTKLTSS